MPTSLYQFRAMGTSCSIQIVAEAESQADMVAALAMAEVERIEEKYSRYAESSTLSQLNREAGKGAVVSLDDETAALVDFAFACYRKSDGLFDITAGVLRRAWHFSSGRLPSTDAINAILPLIGMEKLRWESPHLSFSVPGMELDLGGIGKEYAVDRLAALISSEGIESGLIDLGGDMFVLGPHPDGKPWEIGLRNPNDTGTIFGQVKIVRGALATSGDYERCMIVDRLRYGHILNPRTGWPVQGLSSVSVLAPQCMVAGSATTIALLRGHGGIPWLAGLEVPHRWVDELGQQGGNMPSVWSS